MKKNLFVVILFSIFIFTIPADDLADILQDLAVQTACLGMYSSTEAGNFDYITNRYIDPRDWYNPPMMANRFAAMSGNMTRIETFYGVCFDYAEFAWKDIKEYQKLYNDAGMKNQEWYIAMANAGDPNTIILYDPVSRENATIISNGVYLKEKLRYKIYAHDGASGHAWLWVQHKNGTWYWIDPTWTDNTGYVWWGIVKDGREVQYYPDSKYCVASNYPRPGAENTETRSSDSTYYTANSNYFLIGYNYAHGVPFGLTIADSMFFERSLIYISTNFNFSSDPRRLEIEWIYGFAISLNNWLRIPIGIGGNHVGVDGERITGSETKTINGNKTTEYHYSTDPLADWKHSFVIEAGLLVAIADKFYLSATYRLIGFSISVINDWSIGYSSSRFTIGAGFIW